MQETTWADAYGVWHARVPQSRHSAHIARKAIRGELEARQAAPLGPLYLKRVPELATPGWTVYRETES